MRWQNLRPSAAFLRTRVARRVLLLFSVCALVPVAALAVTSYFVVSKQLHDQSLERVTHENREARQAVAERLTNVRLDLAGISEMLRRRMGEGPLEGALDSFVTASPRLRGVTLQTGSDEAVRLGGPASVPSALSAKQRENLGSGKEVLAIAHGEAGPMIFVGRILEVRAGTQHVVWLSLDHEYLAVGEEGRSIPTDMELCLLDYEYTVLFCTMPLADATVNEWRSGATVPSQFEWRSGGETYIGGSTQISLGYEWASPNLTVVVSQPRLDFFDSVGTFKRWFPLIILLTVLVALYLSNVQIRTSMDPLEKLQEGTQRIAARDFDSRVHVESQDEFQDLATSFNAMANRLGRQFNALTTINEIDRAVLSALDTDVIVDTVLARARGVIECDGVALSLAESDGAAPQWTLFATAANGSGRAVKNVQLSEEELGELAKHREFMFLGPERRPSYLDVPVFRDGGIRSFLAGAITLGYTHDPPVGEEDVVQARQLADQVAVALSNARLLEELDDFNWGALAALAQTVDAKSPWTAGHSQRVTQSSLRVGRKMGLDPEQLDVLHRGGLLHDIGKIGVPAEVLDKPGRLNDEEYAVMKQHVTIGARILKPIAAYAGMIPIVLRHHERMDGTGYPDGLVGEEIPFLARLLAVPDVFDALTSDRPYRKAMPYSEATALIESESGDHFDPQVVAAFKAAMQEPESEAPQELRPVFPEVGTA
jgi:putative nucleotidyltransferase with HDIG domain